MEEDARGAYVMNARDLNMIAHLDDLAAAGVDSLKIEGRNKKAFYVATAVHAYRSVLDGAERVRGGCGAGRGLAPAVLDGVLLRARRAVARARRLRAGVRARGHGGARRGARVVVVCHNRFREGDELEVLSPRRPVARVRVRNLAWLPAPELGEPAALTPACAPVPVPVANRSAERYSFEAEPSLPLAPGDYLRVRAI